MGRDVLADDGLTAKVGDTAQPGKGQDADHDARYGNGPGEAATHFARLSPGLARLALAALVLLLLASALVPTARPGDRLPWQGAVDGKVAAQTTSAEFEASGRDADIALYDLVAQRIAAGEHYYDFIVAQQRSFDFPVRPGVAVRLPTLAYLAAWLGEDGLVAAAFALIAGVLIAWWGKFAQDATTLRRRGLGIAVLALGMSLALNRHFLLLHELWAGGLLALSFGLYRSRTPGKRAHRIGAFLAAALALAIREHALPFVMLMAAFAAFERNWREAGAWLALIGLFAAGLAAHLGLVARDVVPGDAPSASWLALRGLSGGLSNVVQASNLRWLPHYLAGPLVVAACFGWLGWNGREGLFGFLLAAGYGLAFTVAGRWDNFYWGAMIAPVMGAGIVFAPRALAALVRQADLAVEPDPAFAPVGSNEAGATARWAAN